MPNPTKHTWISRNFGSGLCYDVASQVSSLISDSSFLESYNMRQNGVNTNQLALVKINGDQLLYPLIDNRPIGGSGSPLSANYICVGADFCNNYLFEIWVDFQGILPSLVRINGLIVLYSTAFIVSPHYYFNTHCNQSQQGGLVAATNSVNDPYLFNLVDILENAGINYATGQTDHVDFPPTEKYFTAFNIALITQTLSNYCDHPVFVEIATANPSGCIQLGSGGLNGGLYIYSIQLATQSGDTLNWSAPTPPIPVPGNLSPVQSAYPFGKTYGLPVASPSPYGIHFRFRVTNLYGIYASVNILRIAYNNGYPPNTPAPIDIIASIPINTGIAILDCFDFGAVASSTITSITSSNTLSIINAANSNRFFGRRLYYAAPTYESKDLSYVTFLDAGNIPCYAQTVNMGLASHKHPYNFTYYRHYQLGEQYAYGAVFYDTTFAQTFTTPVPMPSSSLAYPNTNAAYPAGFQFPNRRDAEQQTGVGSTLAASTQNVNSDVTIGNTYEVFDLAQAISKNNSAVNNAELTVAAIENFYAPFRPTQDSDPVTYLWDYNPTTTVSEDGSTFVAYNPTIFNLDYHATGLTIKGITTSGTGAIPLWVGGVSLVRSERANRVICQGFGFYDSTTTFNVSVTKAQDDFIFYSPDVNSGIVDFQSIINNIGSGRYAIQFVSPLGLATEVYSNFNPGTGQSVLVDMISYARVLYENGGINPGDGTGTNGINGYTAYGRWRQQTSPTSVFNGGEFGNNTFTITGITSYDTDSGRQELYKITSSGNNFYGSTTVTTGLPFNNSTVRAFHEPFYVVNIIDTAAGLPQNQDFETYIDSGTFIKTQGVIGIGNGASTQNYLLVDERASDTTNNFISGSSWTLGQYFVTVKDLDGNTTTWIDITSPFNTGNTGELTSAYNAIVAHTYGGAYIVTSNNYDISNPLSLEYTVQFSGGLFAALGGGHNSPVPPNGYQIIVTYNNNSPIQVFGGDTTIGESTFAYFDGYGTESDSSHEGALQYGLPYYTVSRNPNVFLFDYTNTAILPYTTLDLIRQEIVMFTSESRTNLGYDFCSVAPDYQDRMFPNVHYILKPMGLSGGETASTYVIMPNYGNDYPDMISGSVFTAEITYGGFRFKQNNISTNIDYSHEDNQFSYTSKPSIFNEQNTFSDRIIWSDQRIPNAQDVPGFQTFPPGNYFDLSEDTGAINYLWDCYTTKGSNLYALTDRGVCLAVTNQFITQQSTGSDALIINDGSQQGVLQEVWLSKTVGLPFQMWRTAATYNNTLYFTNLQSSYKLVENTIIDLSRQKYYKRMYGDVLSNIDGMNDIGLSGVFDVANNEYWVGMKQNPLAIVPAWSGSINITGANSFYLYALSNGSPFTVTVNVPQGSIFYVSNQCAVNINLTDAINSTSIATLLVGDVYQIIYNGQTSYTVNNLGAGIGFQGLPFGAGLTFAYYDKTAIFVNQTPTEGVKSTWNGYYSYLYDKMVENNGVVYGIVSGNITQGVVGGTYVVGQTAAGYTLASQDNNIVVSGAVQAHAGEPADNFKMKEFVKIRVNNQQDATMVPSIINFYDDMDEYRSGNIQCYINNSDYPLVVLKPYYNGWEGWVPRRTASPNARLQGNVFIYEIIHNTNNPFYINDVGIQYKNLR